MKKVTIMQVAAYAGVSPSTASKVLNGTESIGRETAERVYAAAAELGYKPNRAAQLLASKNKKIGIILPREPHEVYNLHEAGFMEALEEYSEFGFQTEMIHYDRDKDAEEFPAAMEKLKRSINGLLFIHEYRLASYLSLLKTIGIPAVSIQNEVDGTDIPSVTVDEPAVGRMAAEFLDLMGHGSCTAIISGDRNAAIHRRNIEGFLAYAGGHGMNLCDIRDTLDSFEVSYRQTEEMLDAHRNLSGIFVSTYTAPAVCACIKAHGAGERVRVIGVDIYDRSAACLRDGSLSAVIFQNQPEQAKRAFSLLLSMLHEQQSGMPVTTAGVKIKPELVLSSNLEHYLKKGN